MENKSCPGAQPRQKIPKDGLGPRGQPDCYYTSRVLNSTYRYVRFVKKLRAREEEERVGTETHLRDTKNIQRSEFFARSDRRNLINQVGYRVDLCMQSYQNDLQQRRNRLSEMLTAEEKLNTRKFVEQVQKGPELIWQGKLDRLAYLLDKRHQEHQAKHAATPLSKASHLHPCLVNIRTKEAQEFQLYQMREKQMRKEAEKEMENMWHNVTLKHAEALAARMEYDAMESVRRDNECKQHNSLEVERHRQQRAKEREKLKEQMLQMKLDREEDERKMAEEKLKEQEESIKMNKIKMEVIKEREETIAKQEADTKLVNDAWDNLTALRVNDGKLEEELRRQKEKDQDECNRKMAELKHNIAKVKVNNESLIEQEGARRQDEVDLKRCQYRKWSQKTKMEDATANKKAYLEKEAASAKDDETKDYYTQLRNQLEALVKHKQLTEGQAKKLYQDDLRDQIAYNNYLKERARQEELDQIKKCEIATRKYYKEMEEMLCRPYYSNDVHPFMKQMASGLQIAKCPCSRPNYCADPKPSENEKT